MRRALVLDILDLLVLAASVGIAAYVAFLIFTMEPKTLKVIINTTSTR